MKFSKSIVVTAHYLVLAGTSLTDIIGNPNYNNSPSSLVSAFAFLPNRIRVASINVNRRQTFNRSNQRQSNLNLNLYSINDENDSNSNSESIISGDKNQESDTGDFLDDSAIAASASATTTDIDEDDNNGEHDHDTTTTAPAKPSGPSPHLLQALAEARALKARAEKERLEAERLSTLLILDKISSIETKLDKINNNNNKKDDVDVNRQRKQRKELMQQMAMLQQQLKPANTNNTLKSIDASITTPLVTSNRMNANDDDDDDDAVDSAIVTYQMPTELLNKRIEAYQKFSPSVKQLFQRVVHTNAEYNIDKDDKDEQAYTKDIIQKCYQIEMQRKAQGNTAPMDILDIANAQAGYETLPLPIQFMVKESIDLLTCSNNTLIVETLVKQNKVGRTSDGGVEFKMEDPDEKEVKERGEDREFTEEEVDSAIKMYENLPKPMKVMLAKSVDEKNEGNSTAVVERLIMEKKLLPSEDGVEFVVFGSGDDALGSVMGDSQDVGYLKGMLPEVTRKEGQAPTEEEAKEFLQLLGKTNFNPTNKPEKIPGGFVIRGKNTLANGEELIKALDAKLKDSILKDKLYYYFMKDPTAVTQEQFESADYELPVIVLTGNDLSPTTNRFVKPTVTALGGLSIASFAVAVCLSTDLNMDVELMKTMISPLLFAVLGTQIAHELMHQLVALKDKFKAGTPTIVPSLQMGLQGCITPIISPPPSLNSLFDFALSGPLVGLLISVILMYAGLEKQVFMDTATQASLPSLPVDLVRSSSLAGGMIEWLLGDGTLVSSVGEPSALIKLHPYAIAGFIGILSNALNLLPVGNTDGGRLAQAMFGRTFSKFIRGTTLVLMVGAGFFGGDEANLLLFFAIFAQIWQKETEIPCKNEIDGVSDERAILAFMTAFLVGLAVVPL